MIEFANDGEMLTVGKLLKNERERQELTLEDISDRTKIHVKFLAAIEEEKKDQFPGDLYQELFTKSYAEALGLEYSRIKAGTFSPARSRRDLDSRGRGRDDSDRDRSKKSGGKALKQADRDGKSALRSPARSPSSGDAADFASNGADSTADSEGGGEGGPVAEAGKPAAKPDIVRYLVLTAAVIICLFIVFVYISISSRDTEEQNGLRESPGKIPGDDEAHESALTEKLAAMDDSVRRVMRKPAEGSSSAVSIEEDTFVDGPVLIYPESLEVRLRSTDTCWASVRADGKRVFSEHLKSDIPLTFRALRELDIELGRWELVTGAIYGHPMKPMGDFHVRGNNAVRLKITKENWESYIDSAKSRYERD